MIAFKNQHFLTGEELSQKELLSLLETAYLLREGHLAQSPQVLQGKTLALIFEKPSLRTRVSFTVGIQDLGGRVVELTGSQKKEEDPEDTIRVLQGMVQGVMARTFSHSTLERMVSKATIPVINGLSDTHHPCQALADLLTIWQKFGKIKNLTLAYIGDGNNVLHSLLLLAPFVGVNIHYSCPEGYQPNPEILKRAQLRAALGGATLRAMSSPQEAARGAHALYTDVWVSMGQETEKQERVSIFSDYQINAKLLQEANEKCIIMHCLPMKRGLEITDDMVEHPRSAIFQQAENRLHAQKALMMGLFLAQKSLSTQSKELSHVI